MFYKIIFVFSILLIIFSILKKKSKYENYNKNLEIYKIYINNCNNLKKTKNIKIKKKKLPFLSICIPLYNMEKYIKKALLSIMNQFFQDYEIILIDDFSIDNTINIIKNQQDENIKIRVIKHNSNLGIYRSRIDGVLNSNGKYIYFLDADDLILNPNLFDLLYKYNLKTNLDMIEFTVYHKNENDSNLYFPESHFFNHYHDFKKNIILQPELSNIIFYKPNSSKYSMIICRTIWNKIIRKQVILKTFNYIGNEYYNILFILAEDTFMNILNFHFAYNYSNINLPGYMYNLREKSISHGNHGINHSFIQSTNIFLYFKLFYQIIKEFNKDRNFLFYEIKEFNYYLFNLKNVNDSKYISDINHFLLEIIKDKFSSIYLKKYCKNFLKYYNKF